MSTYDVDAWIETTERPSIKLNGKVHQGRLLSYQEFLPFIDRLLAIQHGTAGNDNFLTLSTDYLNLIFPPSKIVRWKPTVAQQVLQLPNLQEVMSHFLELTTAAVGMRKTESL